MNGLSLREVSVGSKVKISRVSVVDVTRVSSLVMADHEMPGRMVPLTGSIFSATISPSHFSVR